MSIDFRLVWKIFQIISWITNLPSSIVDRVFVSMCLDMLIFIFLHIWRFLGCRVFVVVVCVFFLTAHPFLIKPEVCKPIGAHQSPCHFPEHQNSDWGNCDFCISVRNTRVRARLWKHPVHDFGISFIARRRGWKMEEVPLLQKVV